PRPTLFVGRLQERRKLAAALLPAGSCPPVVALSGRPGVGKTALALSVAHEAAARFPDGQLYADLGGATQDGPVTADELACWFLRALGDSTIGPATGLRAASARLRSITTDRRVLMVLDNAVDEEQVLPLLPTGVGCAVLVTSRRPLPLDHAAQFPLPVLSAADSVTLLTELVGGARLAGSDQDVAAIVRHCHHLPLAVRAVGALLCAHPDWSVRFLATQLASGRCRVLDLRYGNHRLRDRLCVPEWPVPELEPAGRAAETPGRR
ncbi:SARP family transcriptional regulator, partial [Plantactinospora sp. S1510]